MLDRYRLQNLIPKHRIHRSDLIRHSYARDAGFYRLVPQMVVRPETKDEIAKLFKFASQSKRKLVFRAAGTSLSGQAVTDDILVEARKGWQNFEILDEGKAISMSPGVAAARANQVLSKYGVRIGPDPGSLAVALIGGIVANNASGIGSGTHANSYQTLAGMEMVLPNGLILNTAVPQDDERFHHEAPEIYSGLLNIQARINGNPVLRKRIREKYKLKNTMGYGLNAFLDYKRPIEILAHLMVGSEGTLGFISRVTLNTVPVQPHRSTSLVRFGSLADAAVLVPGLKRLGVYACEILDAAALRTVQESDESIEIIPDGSSALLLEFQEEDPDRLAMQTSRAKELIQTKYPEIAVNWFENEQDRMSLWRVRRELGPLQAAKRPAGTTVLSEDVCFKVKDLARAIKDLQSLFKRYAFQDAVIFGHAGDGNLHFKLSIDLSSPHAIERYAEFLQDLATLVIEKYDGSLKAEHGTGRNMASFVRQEWGAEAYQIMAEIKHLLDPQGILNPDVIISSDPRIHLKHLKPIPHVDPGIDLCIECGLCEPVCPSREFTLTPRQRINVLREIRVLEGTGEDKRIQSMRGDFALDGIDSCAADGLCATVCPVDVDTGQLMKALRGSDRGFMARGAARWSQSHFHVLTILLRLGMRVMVPIRPFLTGRGEGNGSKLMNRLTRGRWPALNQYLQAAPRKAIPGSKATESPDLIYFPSCLTRTVNAGHPSGLSVAQAFKSILEKAGRSLVYPQGLGDLCCGLSFSSKGFTSLAARSARETTEMLWEQSRGGKIPIVMDTSPCSHFMQNYDQVLSGVSLARWRKLKIHDLTDYLHDELLPHLNLTPTTERLVLHPSCSTQKSGGVDKMMAVAERCSTDVRIPDQLGCCGFAGDRGLFHPGLPASASADEVREIKALGGKNHASSSRMCEIGLSLESGQDFTALIFQVYEALQRTQGG